MNILISSAGRRNELISYFKKNACIKKVVVCDMNPYAVAFEESDVGYIAPAVLSDEYEKFLYDTCKKEKIDLMFTLNDIELPILSRIKEKLSSIGTFALVSDAEIIDICWDKTLTNKFLVDSGFYVPDLYSFEEINKEFSRFPLIIKPRFGTASIGVEVVKSFEEFDLLYRYVTYKVDKSLLGNIAGGGDLLIQEKVEGDQYAVDIINNLEGEYQGCVIKRKIGIRDGDADCVISVVDDQIENWCKKLSQALNHIGNVDCDLICVENQIYCVDINPRFGGAYPFSHLSGVDLPGMIVSWIKRKPIKETFTYSAGVVSARTEKYMALSKLNKLISLTK